MKTLSSPSDLKALVREKYGAIARQDIAVQDAACCGSVCCSSDDVYNIMSDDYSNLDGYVAEADLGLGCGLPTQFAHIQQGDTVVDLGSGAGNDCFIARRETGESGYVIGIDFTPAMLEKARANAQALGYTNVEFREGDIENIPLEDNIANVVVSNCVLNLVPNKQQVFQEIYRILKPGGHCSISYIVLVGELPSALQHDAEMYAGCVAGAIQKEQYAKYIAQVGFIGVTIQKQKPIILPDSILRSYLSEQEIAEFKNGVHGIFSITVFAQKP